MFSLENEGWPILYNEKRKKNYEQIIGEKTMKIGVLGLNNVGKSFLLKKLACPNIPSGASIETKGISIKYADPNDNNGEIKGICILDSAGNESPLLREEVEEVNKEINVLNKEKDFEKAIKINPIENQLSRDKAQTERFIEQLIISLSDMVILVIGKITRTEQQLINRIKKLVKSNKDNKIKSIIVVHNLAQFHKKLEVERHIEEKIKKSATFLLEPLKYLGKKKEFTDRSYLVETPDTQKGSDLQVFHYIMAKEGTEAGKYYNPFTLHLIEEQYNRFTNRRAINIPEEIIKIFSKLSPDILGKKMECKKVGEDKNIAIKLIKDNNNNENNEVRKNNELKLQKTLKDQDGYYSTNNERYEANYSLYYFKEVIDEDEEEYENYLLLRIEIPGNIVRLTARKASNKNEEKKGIIIKGLKKKDNFKEQSKQGFTLIDDNRIYDELYYFIPLPNNYNLAKLQASDNTEIYEIEFDNDNKEKTKQKKINENKEIEKKRTENDNEDSKKSKKENNIMNIASGVYVMKFLLDEDSSPD